ncbi:MAG TPA: acyl carrier protein [Gemmatimonadaceae bacterium]|nr:acyl carrier protein [Gemmatimonadaceae bacterium]
MSTNDIREAILRALRRIAPEADPATIDPARPLREQVDLDSVDFLNFLIGVHQELGVEVPEEDYPQVATLAGCVAYVEARMPAAG